MAAVSKLNLSSLLWFLTSSFLFANVNAAEKISYTPEEAMAVKRIAQVAVSPQGNQTAFTVMQMAITTQGKVWQAVNYLKNDQGHVFPFTPTQQLSFFPTWSPNGKVIAYIGSKPPKQTVYLYDTQTRQTKELFSLDKGIAALKWSPDEQYIAFVAPDDQKTNLTKLLKNPATNYINLRLYRVSTKIPAKNTQTIIEALSPANVSITANAAPWVDGGFDWSPNSQTIAYAYQPHVGSNEIREAKVALINLKDRTVTNIPWAKNKVAMQPRFSFDGQWLAFKTNANYTALATALNNNPELNSQVCVMNMQSLKINCLANTFNENPTILGWDKNNKNIWVSDAYKTTGQQIYRLSLDINQPAILFTNNHQGLLDVISMNQDSSVFSFAYETTSEPAEPYISQSNKFKLEKIATVQTQANTQLSQVKTINWKSIDGMPIEGVLITPPDYDAKKKYPLLLAIHGGPEGVWQQHYTGGCESGGGSTLIPCWGILANKGFVILQPNPRGSNGYGKQFRLANFADWGGKDYQDIMSGVDYLIHQGVVDANHMAVSGWSYGGYMTAWIITQTQRFKAAMVGAGMSNLISFAGTTDLTRNVAEYFGQPVWQSPLYLKRSPLMQVNKIVTPTLIVHGDADDRVPTQQAYELYNAMKVANKPVELLIMPGQGHIPGDPAITLSAIYAINAWLGKAL